MGERFQSYELPKIQLDLTGPTYYWIPPGMVHTDLQHQPLAFIKPIREQGMFQISQIPFRGYETPSEDELFPMLPIQ